MTSESQELRGYPIPNVINPATTRCIAITIPDDDAYHRAVIAQVTLLTKWWKWKRTNPQDAHAKQCAEAVASVLAYSPLDNPLDCALIDGELEMFDCGDVEDCLETSVIVSNIETNITNVSNTVSNHTTEITNLTEEVTEIIENSTYNEYPPEPEPSEELDSYCGASWSIANYLNDFIQQVITDAQTITLQEFFTAILGLGGFKTSIVKVLWDYIIASINPNLSTEVSDALPYVAEAFYCNFLNPDSAKADIIANTNITSDAEATYVSAIDALTIAKFSELIFLGSLNESEDCSSFSCGCGEYDFTKSLHGFTIINGIYEGALGVKRDGTGQAIIQLTGMPKTFRIDRWEMDYVMNAPSGVKGAQVRVTDATTGVTQSSGGNPIADGTLRTTGAFLGDPNSNGLRFTLFNTGGLCWIKKVRIYYTRETGAPQNSAPTC